MKILLRVCILQVRYLQSVCNAGRKWNAILTFLRKHMAKLNKWNLEMSELQHSVCDFIMIYVLIGLAQEYMVPQNFTWKKKQSTESIRNVFNIIRKETRREPL